jgi:MFS family permease
MEAGSVHQKASGHGVKEFINKEIEDQAMKDQITVSRNFKIITCLLIAIGAVTFIIGLITDHKTTWANYLIVNYYFLSLAIGGAFFLVLQSISQSGWSSAFKRVSEAMMSYIPFAALFFLLLGFGMTDLYTWTNNDVVSADPVLLHKSAFLNIPFFFVRMVLYFILWIFLAWKLRRISLQEDALDPSDSTGIMVLFGKTELYSKIFIFILAITFSLSAIDWIMSVDVKWYSTIFALKNMVAAFFHGVSILALIVFILHKKGYFPFFNKYHLHDFARYIFMFSIIWGYFWFAQFMIIWYGNIPEETVYYSIRWKEGWKVLFFLEIGLNWFIPFMVLLPVKASRNMTLITIVIVFLIIGQYIDLFVQVIPGTTGAFRFGWISAGTFLGFAGLFALVVATALSKAKLIPSNHPYLEESVSHKF